MKDLRTFGIPEPPEPPPKREFRTGLIGLRETKQSKRRTAEWLGIAKPKRTGLKVRIVLPLIGLLVLVALIAEFL